MKKQLGQFFTTNSNYILQGLEEFVKNKEIIDPFAGNQDLIKWTRQNGCKKAVGFDCDQKYVDGKNTLYNDSINSPLKYKFVCTNPPYLHKNKADKKIKEKFFSDFHSNFEDLYQVSIFSILDCDEGILILPLNFLSAENSKRIRNLFFDKFKILKLNIFSEQVFEDTTYNVISFYFKKKKNLSEKEEILTTIFPEKKQVIFTIEKKYNWQFGGNFVSKIENVSNLLGIFRLTENHLKPGKCKMELSLQNIENKIFFLISEDTKKEMEKNILLLRALDSKNGKKIQLEDRRVYGVLGLVDKNTSRSMAHLIFKKEISIKNQVKLMKEFNKELNQERNKYLSFFLTNFRDNNRKRISFEFTYKFLNYIYDKKNIN